MLNSEFYIFELSDIRLPNYNICECPIKDLLLNLKTISLIQYCILESQRVQTK